MKIKKSRLWYIGYAIAAGIAAVILFGDFSEITDAGLGVAFAAVFAVTHVRCVHQKMLEQDEDYKMNVMDERNIAIKEKAGNIGNMINMALLGVLLVVFIVLGYDLPAVLLGAVIVIQPFLLIVISTRIGRRM